MISKLNKNNASFGIVLRSRTPNAKVFSKTQIELINNFESIGLPKNEAIGFVTSHLSQGYKVIDLKKTYSELKSLLN